MDKSQITHNNNPATIIKGGVYSLKENKRKITAIDQLHQSEVGLPTNLKAFITAAHLKKNIFDGIDIKDRLGTTEAIDMLIDGELDYIIGGQYRYNSIARKMKRKRRGEKRQ